MEKKPYHQKKKKNDLIKKGIELVNNEWNQSTFSPQGGTSLWCKSRCTI